jgi:hypothetical protein
MKGERRNKERGPKSWEPLEQTPKWVTMGLKVLELLKSKCKILSLLNEESSKI